MIKITPYYDRSDGEDILKRYLRMVADVVPFLPEDVLFDDEEGVRQQTRKKKKISPKEAEICVRNYSEELHAYLYEGCSGGRINRDNFRTLLTVKLPQGQLPENLCFRGRSKEAARKLSEDVFRYEAFSRRIYWFVQSLGVEVCPYCNRMFITTVDEAGKRVRPQLDHFKNKSKYPYLALSINNLVPNCGVCNLLKGDRDEPILYPYEEGFGDDYVFRTDIPTNITEVLTGAKASPQQFHITIGPGKNGCDLKKEPKIEASIEVFALQELYNNAHKEYVSRLYFQRYITTEQWVEDTCHQFKSLFSTEEEVRFALTAMDPRQEHWGKSPLAKLTHDIQEEIEELYRLQMREPPEGKKD